MGLEKSMGPIDGEGEEISTSVLVWRAVKLPIYSVALVPLTVSAVKSSFFLAEEFFSEC